MNSLSLVRISSTLLLTIGRLFVLDDFANPLFDCYTLELPWRENKQNISCIPIGRYPIRPRTSKKYGLHLEVLNVPDRSYILIHEANFVSQLRGCIAVGRFLTDINFDGLLDVSHSKEAKQRITSLITEPTELIIS